MTRETVAAAIEQVKARDPELGTDAEVAAQWLTTGEGTETIYQASVQRFLWWTLPRKFPAPAWRRLVAAAAALLDELGFADYADLARARTTSDILEAWATSAEEGRKQFLAVHAASGVDPPDTELVQWGSVMGIDEATAQEAVERALEAAISVGELNPGTRGWKQMAQRICDRTLIRPLHDPGGQTLLTRLITERTEWWIDAARVPAHRRMRDNVSRRLLTSIPAPADLDAVTAPMRWLLDHAVAGVTLTQSGYLARQLVLESAERFAWWDWDKPPRSEADVPQLGMLRDVAAHLRLTRRKGRQLVATAKGTRLLADPEALWRALVTTLGGRDEFGQMIAELVGLRLLEGAAFDDELSAAVAPIVLAQRWRTSGGPITERDVGWAISLRKLWWRVLCVVREEQHRWDGTEQPPSYLSVELTECGVATMLAYLRQRAIAPRHGLFD